MKTTKMIKQEQEDVESLRPGRSVAPQGMVQGNEHFDGMLDNKRFDITDEKVDWRLD